MNERADGGFDLEEIVGHSVTRISLMGLVRLNFEDPPGFNVEKPAEIRLDVERDFTIRPQGGQAGAKVEFRPYLENWTPSRMSELVGLFGAVVVSARADPDATLRITFADNRELEVLPDPQYEGWGFSAGGHLIGQTAGNGLYYFPPPP
jgi:hypothetical protein